MSLRSGSTIARAASKSISSMNAGTPENRIAVAITESAGRNEGSDAIRIDTQGRSPSPSSFSTRSS